MKRSILQVVLAQGVVLAASVLKSLMLPAVLDVDGFAYWQVYVLYSGFVGVFAFGYSDGVYLKYGERNYSDLPFERIRASMRIYIASLLVFSAVTCTLSIFDSDFSRGFSFFFVGVDILLTCLSGLLLYVLQITNQIKIYSIFATVDKVAMIIFIGVIVLFFAEPDFRMVVVADVLAKASVTIALVVWCRRLFVGPSASLVEGVRGYAEEARIGFSLLIANLAGMLAVNAGRFMVEIFGSTADYAYYSFGVSITNLVLMFVSAVALVIYPNLKRMRGDRVLSFFDEIDAAAMKVVGVGFMLYVPAVLFVVAFIPKYEPMLSYLGFMFLAVAGQTKMQLLGNTYYKALRKERRMLFVNVQAVVVFLIIGGVLYLATKSVAAIAAATALVLICRAWASERELRSELKIARSNKIIVEIAFCVAFAIASLVPAREISLALTECVGVACFVVSFAYGKRFV